MVGSGHGTGRLTSAFWFRVTIAATTSLIAFMPVSIPLLIQRYYVVVRPRCMKAKGREGEEYEPAIAARGVDRARMEYY